MGSANNHIYDNSYNKKSVSNLSQDLRHVVRIPGAQFLAPELFCDPSYDRLKVQNTSIRISKRQHDCKEQSFLSGPETYLTTSNTL